MNHEHQDSLLPPPGDHRRFVWPVLLDGVPLMNEDQAERVRLAAERLAVAEAALIQARKKYNQAMRAYDRACQVKLEGTSYAIAQ